jgi:hypothetical protein
MFGWLRSLFRPGQQIEVSDLFLGDAHAVLCEEGLSMAALTYLSVPPLEWYLDGRHELIGLSVPRRIDHRLPDALKKKVKCWYFRSDLPLEVLTGNEDAWKGARIEQPEPGIWCVYFTGVRCA